MRNLQASLSQVKKPNPLDELTFSEVTTTRPSVIYLYKYISFVLCVLFIAVFLTNLYVDSLLTSKKEVLEKSSLRISGLSYFEKTANLLDKTITRYKELVSSKDVIYTRFFSVYSAIPSEMKLSSFTLSKTDFSLFLTGDNLISFSKLLDTLVKNPLIKEIYLQDASLILSEDVSTYNVAIKGVFK